MAETREIIWRMGILAIVIILLLTLIAINFTLIILNSDGHKDSKMEEDCINQGFNYLSGDKYSDYGICYYLNDKGVKVYLNYDFNRGIWYAN